MDCKEALKVSNGNFEKAVDFLREKGLSAATKKSSRATKDGLVTSYIHMGGKVGVMIEVNCETDFVAKTAGHCRGQAREDRRQDRRGKAEEVLRGSLPHQAEVHQGHEHNGRGPDQGIDRSDGGEHPREALRPLPARRRRGGGQRAVNRTARRATIRQGPRRHGGGRKVCIQTGPPETER